MKKMGFVLIIAFLAIGTISAQNWGNQWGGSQSVTVEGTLQLQNGQIAISTGNAFYFVPEIERYIGFIDGLKEGSHVSIDGYASGNYLQPVQMTFNGKSYDFQVKTLGAYGDGYGSCCYGTGGYGARGGGWGRRW